MIITGKESVAVKRNSETKRRARVPIIDILTSIFYITVY